MFFSNRGQGGVIYEILDQDHNTLVTLSLQDFKGLLEAQEPGIGAKIVA